MLEGKSFSMDVVANIHYGFVGAASGFGLETLQIGAGAAQIWDGTSQADWSMTYFDDPADSFAVWLGYYLYQQYGSDMTTQEFTDAILQNQQNLQPPK